MSRASKIIIGLAILSAITPLLGVPGVVKDGFVVVLGFAIAAITYWAEKHARFCPECNVSDPRVHDHGERNNASESFVQKSVSASIAPSAPTVMRPDIAPKEFAAEPSLPTSPSLSPFSFDAEQVKTKTVRRRGRKKEIVS